MSSDAATADRVQPRTRDITQALRFALRQVVAARAPAMAANLAFRTLFGLLPVLVVATIVTRAILGDRFGEVVQLAMTALGLDAVSIVPADGSRPDGVPLDQWILSLVEHARQIDLSAIGLVGALTVVFSAVWTMVAIETSFNAIYRAPSGRPFVRRVLVYWFVLTAAPVLVAAIPAALRSAADFAGADSAVVSLAARALSTVGGFVALWLLLGTAYATVPNTKVNIRAAMIGAFVAALLIELGKRFLGASLSGSFAASRLYGSLGLVPLFMMWVYLMWLAVLFGLLVSSVLQGFSRHGRALAAYDGRDVFEPASAVACFESIAESFAKGRPATVEHIVRSCSVSPTAARDLLAIFERSGLVLRVDGGDRRFTPARPPETILRADALRSGFAFADGGVECPADDEIRALRDAQIAALGDRTFATRRAATGQSGQSPQ